MTEMMTRAAVVKRNWACKSRETLERYLPDNYKVTGACEDAFFIVGEDAMGWTLDGYVLPRLSSGMIFARELTEEERSEWIEVPL